MYKVSPQEQQEHREHREHCQLHHDGPIPLVDVIDKIGGTGQELKNVDEMCFVRTVAQLLLDEITVEEYFDRLIDHLRIDAVLHHFDNNRPADMLENLSRVDLISWTVQCMMLDESFKLLDVTDATKLKKLCVMVYRAENADDLRRDVVAAGMPLESLPPHWLNILALIAYARCDVATLEHLVTYKGPPIRSAFDQLGRSAMLCRQTFQADRFQHFTISHGNRLVEIKLWTALIQSHGNDWIHYPMTAGESQGLVWGIHRLLQSFGDEVNLRASPEMEKFCRALSRHGIIRSSGTVAGFLSNTGGHEIWFPEGLSPCGLTEALMILSCFPLSKILKDAGEKSLGPGRSANLLIPLTQWGLDNPDRLVVMRTALEQGYDVNDTCSLAPWPNPNIFQPDTPLHQAAQRGDDAMVDLLLEFGARGDVVGGGGGDVKPPWQDDGDDSGGLVDNMASYARGDMAPDAGVVDKDTPAHRARKFGHTQIAAKLEAHFGHV